MKKNLTLIFVLLLSSGFISKASIKKQKRSNLPKYSHIVIVIEENKDYRQVIGNKDAPYENGVLVKEGANLTRMFAEEHNSEGNYFWLFAGGNHNVGYSDVIPDSKNNNEYPFKSANLGEELISKGYSFKGYAESLPHVGDTVSRTGLYARKHVPWISFSNIPGGESEETSSFLQFRQFPKDYNKLPTVSIVVPNLINDMHSGDPAVRVKAGDEWLKKNINRYYQWAKKHNSLLIITWDENSNNIQFKGLTNPASKEQAIRNRIPTIIAGAHIRHGDYSEGRGVTHVNILRTIESIYGLPHAGHQQANALKYGIKDNYIITDIFLGKK